MVVLEDGFEPPSAHFFRVPLYLLELLQRVCDWTRPRESNALVAVLQTAAFPFGEVGLAPGEGFEPSLRGSEPRVLPVRRPWCDL
jgi:hypothetical protein